MGVCDVCSSNQAKYRCPGCSTCTCSLMCCKKHKESSGCSGERNKTAYVKLDGFTDMQLLSDYRFLEDLGRVCDSSRKDSREGVHCKTNQGKMIIVKQAHKRGITLKVSPFSTSRRKQNSTLYLKRSNTILWHIRWCLPEFDRTSSTRRVTEKNVLDDVFTEVKASLPDCQTASGSSLKGSDLELYLKGPGTHRYWKLNEEASLSDNFRGTVIMEHPEIVCCSKDHSAGWTILDRANHT